MKAQEYYIVLNAPFADGSAQATVYNADVAGQSPSLHVVDYDAYADAKARLAIAEAELAELRGGVEVPGIPDGNGGIIPPVV